MDLGMCPKEEARHNRTRVVCCPCVRRPGQVDCADRPQTRGGGGRGSVEGLIARWVGASCRGAENVLERDRGGVCITV